MDRRTAYQERQKKAKRCITCGKPAHVFLSGKRKGKVSTRCQFHVISNRERARKLKGHVRRNKRAGSYAIRKKH